MLKLWKSPPQPLAREDLFVARYERLLVWALRLTGNNREEAEDLLHDAFIDFSLGHSDLSEIENIDGYLRTVLRNIHLSAVRKASRHPSQPLSLVDYDSLEIGLRAVEPQVRLQLQDELRAICEYACLRKETSKSASVLILRFFHDYYPSEVTFVMRTSSRAVSEWLRIARAETKIFVADPTRLNFITKHPLDPAFQLDFGRAGDDLSREIRRALFSMPHAGPCLSAQALRELYNSEPGSAIDCRTLSQIVTCRQCLDAVNAFHGLPLLSERYSEKIRDRHEPPRDGGGSETESGGADATGDKKLKFQRRAKEVFEHRPEELYISANGLFLVSQRINAGRAEQTLSVNIDEEIGFIEVLSEQALRLLLLNVEPPPSGSGQQAKTVSLSDGRTLTATLRFSSSQPSLHIIYDDPIYRTEARLEIEAANNPIESSEATSTPAQEPSRIFDLRLWRKPNLFDFGIWLRPGFVTVLIAVLAVAGALLFLRPSGPAATARDLLQRSASAENVLAAKSDQVFHRTLTLEERRSSVPGAEGSIPQLVARHKIEIWHSAGRGITARRLYDEQNRLVAGAWTRLDGVTTLYQHGAKPQLRLSPQQEGVAAKADSNVWLMSPSASNFLASVKDEGSSELSLEERPGAYVLRYAKQSVETTRPGLVKASLTLNKADLRATEMTLVVASERKNDGHLSTNPGHDSNRQYLSYHFAETAFEQHPANTISPTVFEPERLLISDTDRRDGDTGAISVAAHPSLSASPVASAELEVELLSLLDQVGAFQGEQLSVTRTLAGALMVQAVLDSPQRKAEILNALRPMLNNPAVHLQIETVAEAAERLSRARPATSGPSGPMISNETVAVEKSALPVDSDLRSYFQARGVPADRLDEEIRRYATRVTDRALQALLHARALKQLANQFSPEALQTLDSEARAKWRAMLVEHARAFTRETSGLRRELEPIFFSNASGSEASAALQVESDSDLLIAAARLFEQASAHERTISRAFSNSVGGPVVTPIKSDQFQRSLKSAELLAEKITRGRA